LAAFVLVDLLIAKLEAIAVGLIVLLVLDLRFVWTFSGGFYVSGNYTFSVPKNAHIQ
jgi:hypothetical protein